MKAVLSEHILKELRRHLTCKLKVPARQADAILAFLRPVFSHAMSAEPDPLKRSGTSSPGRDW